MCYKIYRIYLRLVTLEVCSTIDGMFVFALYVFSYDKMRLRQASRVVRRHATVYSLSKKCVRERHLSLRVWNIGQLSINVRIIPADAYVTIIAVDYNHHIFNKSFGNKYKYIVNIAINKLSTFIDPWFVLFAIRVSVISYNESHYIFKLL